MRENQEKTKNICNMPHSCAYWIVSIQPCTAILSLEIVSRVSDSSSSAEKNVENEEHPSPRIGVLLGRRELLGAYFRCGTFRVVVPRVVSMVMVYK